MDEIEIVDHDPGWPAQFAAEAAALRAVLDPKLLLDMEHFGSTAVPGLAAKPVIDILLAVASLDAARACFVAPLAGLGYVFWADNPKTDRLFFVKGMPPYGPRRTHHVHVGEPDGELWRNLAFRDHLRAHPEVARDYERLKRALAARHRDDREAYTEAKSAFIDEVLQRFGRRG